MKCKAKLAAGWLARVENTRVFGLELCSRSLLRAYTYRE